MQKFQAALRREKGRVFTACSPRRALRFPAATPARRPLAPPPGRASWLAGSRKRTAIPGRGRRLRARPGARAFPFLCKRERPIRPAVARASAETRAACDWRLEKGRGGPSKLPRRRVGRIPEKNPSGKRQTFRKRLRPAAPPSSGLVWSPLRRPAQPSPAT